VNPPATVDRAGVFLDRDGVLNRAAIVDGVPRPPANIDELEVLEGVTGACAALHAAGLILVVVTNQPDIARGTIDPESVAALNDELAARLRLDAVLVCPHDDDDDCSCRKPRPGLLLEGAQRYALDLTRSFMVGDRWRDVEAGQRAGSQTVFLDHGYAERRPDHPDLTVASLAEAVPWILGRARSEGQTA
jgi:D-glycero-D-manno-heptose 1,7-bisphosphate phosphatase